MTTIERGPRSDYTAAATAAMTAALEQEPDYSDWLARVLSTVAAMKGSTTPSSAAGPAPGRQTT
jgi:hypothetical protein